MKYAKKVFIGAMTCTLVLPTNVQMVYAQDYENTNTEIETLYVDASSISTLVASASVKTIEIAENVANIPANAFTGFVNVTKIKLPSSIQSIEENAFPHNPNLIFSVYAGSFAHSYVVEKGWNYECMGEEEITIEAQEVTLHTITYELNGGINSPSNPEMFVSTEEPIVLQEATKEGYAFEGWYTDSTYQTRISQIDPSIDNDMVLFAKWGPVSYLINYELNGGTFEKDVITSYTQTNKAITLPTPVRTGYIFGGWYKEDNFVTKATSIVAGSKEDKMFYAKWTPVKYSIQYIGNGSTSGSMTNSVGLVYDQSYALKANTFVKKGYTFSGWNTKADGSGDSYTNMAEVQNLCTKSGAIQKLYAQWSKNEYAINFYANGGEFETTPVSSYNVTTPTITLPKPEKLGYVFNGWYKEDTFKTKVTS
ncbi:MAG: InlB B-repeat-containing protein, partial [Firmicutes bacterium]|nr:InlB B-repeat-containing protein [Bacillota bacterium]